MYFKFFEPKNRRKNPAKHVETIVRRCPEATDFSALRTFSAPQKLLDSIFPRALPFRGQLSANLPPLFSEKGKGGAGAVHGVLS